MDLYFRISFLLQTIYSDMLYLEVWHFSLLLHCLLPTVSSVFSSGVAKILDFNVLWRFNNIYQHELFNYRQLNDYKMPNYM